MLHRSYRCLQMQYFKNIHQFFQISLSCAIVCYKAFIHCLYTAHKCKWMVCNNVTNVFFNHSITSWSELLPLLEKKYGADRCYMFENNVFPNTVTLPSPASKTLPPQSPAWQSVSGVNILAHLYCEPIITETHYSNFKIIVNPRAVFSPTVHGVLTSQNGCAWVDRNIARMYHTR